MLDYLSLFGLFLVEKGPHLKVQFLLSFLDFGWVKVQLSNPPRKGWTLPLDYASPTLTYKPWALLLRSPLSSNFFSH